MKTATELDALIYKLLNDEMSLEDFQRKYESLYIGEDGNNLTESQELYYGQICQKLEFTYSREIPEEEVKYGYLTYEQFKDYVRSYLCEKPA